MWEYECALYVAFRGGDEPVLLSYSSFKTKTLFEHESNEDIGFKVRLRDMTDKEKQNAEEKKRQMVELLSKGGPITSGNPFIGENK